MKSTLNTLVKKASQYKFAVFIAISLLFALCLVWISLLMYNISGAAQLDLSRPSYQEARKKAKEQADKDKKDALEQSTFSNQGTLNQKDIDDFNKLYNEQLDRIQGDFFRDDALSDKTLNLEKQEN